MAFERSREQATLREIFGDPKPPSVVTERQFDQCDEELRALARKPWDAIGDRDFWYYGLDMTYCDLQQDLFDYLFPAFLLLWREGLSERKERPFSGETDLYAAMWKGKVLQKMMDPARRERVLGYMVEAFLAEVETLQPGEIVAEGRNEQLGYFMDVFNAFGQTMPIVPSVLERLNRDMTPGKGRFWLTFAAGLFYPVNAVPWISPWTKHGGGGGVYVLSSATQLFDAPFLPENLEACRQWITVDSLRGLLDEAMLVQMEPAEKEMVHLALVRSHEHREYAETKLNWYFRNLASPSLGGAYPY